LPRRRDKGGLKTFPARLASEGVAGRPNPPFEGGLIGKGIKLFCYCLKVFVTIAAIRVTFWLSFSCDMVGRLFNK